MPDNNAILFQPTGEVICTANTKCKKPCHHAKPHKPTLVTNQGFRGNDIDTHVDHPDGIICTTKGRCDMGLFVKCCDLAARMRRKEYNNADGFDRAHAGENHGGW